MTRPHLQAIKAWHSDPHRRITLLAVSVLLLAFCATPGVAAESGATSVETLGMSLADFCSAKACRKNTRILLRTEQDVLDAELELFWPVLHDGVIHVLPGEKLFLEVEWSGSSLRSVTHVARITDPAKTITVELLQREATVDMILQIRNPFDFPIKFHADMGNLQGGLAQTSTCPVRPKMIAIEHWPYAITQLILTGLQRLPETANAVCEY